MAQGIYYEKPSKRQGRREAQAKRMCRILASIEEASGGDAGEGVATVLGAGVT
jgi:hypothetical protein